MALGSVVAGTVAYSASGGTSVSPTYPTLVADDCLILVIGMKPSTANSGSVTTPSGWTLQGSSLAKGGYGATLGADTGNTNMWIFTKDTVSGSESGTLAVTLATNNVAWASIVRVRSDAGHPYLYDFGEGQDGAGNTTFTSNFADMTDFTAGDLVVWGFCIPSDVTTPTQFSAHAITATGATFNTATELVEPDSTTGNDIGGFLAWASVASGTSTTQATVSATAGGTVTNVRGATAGLRIREDIPNAYTLTCDGADYTMTAQDVGLYFHSYVASNNGLFLEELLTTYKPVSNYNPIMRVRTSAVAQLNFTGQLTFYPDGTNNGGYPVEALWQYRTVGGSWTDVGTAIANTQQAVVVAGALDTEGKLNVATTLTTGLSANTSYDVQLLWRRTTVSPTTPNMFLTPDLPYAEKCATVSAVLATAYTLVCDGATYSLTGQAVNLLFNRRLVADGASYALSGQAVNLLFKRRLVADGASYTLTGQAVNLLFGRKLIADGASYNLTEQDANLLYARRLVADGASYTLTGQAVNLLYGRRLVADGASYALSAQDANLLFGRRLVADGASYTYSAQDVTLTYTPLGGYTLICDGASYTLTAQPANLLFGRRLVADGASYALTAQVANLLYARRMVADGASYALTGQPANLLFNRRLVADTATYALSGQAVNLLFNRRLVADGASYALTAQPANLFFGRKLIADGATYAYAGQTVNFLYARRMVADGATYTLTANPITMTLGSASVKRIYLGGVPLSNVYINDFPVQTAYVGEDIVWSVAPPPRTIIAYGVTYTMTAQPVTMRRGYRLVAGGASYAMSLGACFLKYARVMQAQGASYAMTVGAVTMTKSGSIVNPLLGGRALGAVAYNSDDAGADIVFNADGTITASASPELATDEVNGQRWFTTTPDQTYQILATQISTTGVGTLSGTLGSWLSFPQAWSVGKLGGTNGVKNRVLRFQIRRQSDSVVVSNGTNDYTLSCSTNTGDGLG